MTLFKNIDHRHKALILAAIDAACRPGVSLIIGAQQRHQQFYLLPKSTSPALRWLGFPDRNVVQVLLVIQGDRKVGFKRRLEPGKIHDPAHWWGSTSPVISDAP